MILLKVASCIIKQQQQKRAITVIIKTKQNRHTRKQNKTKQPNKQIRKQARLKPKEIKTQKFKEIFSTYCKYGGLFQNCAVLNVYQGPVAWVECQWVRNTAEVAGTNLKVTKLSHFGKQPNTVIL